MRSSAWSSESTRHQRQHRPEDLLSVHPHGGRDVVDQAWPEPVPALGAPVRVRAPVNDDVRPLALADVEVGRDPVPVLRRDQGAHFGVGIGARSDRQPVDATADPLH